MQHAAALGSREICLTAHHEGGFALWPSAYTNYSVKLATGWRGGAGDVLRDFADAANRWGIKICYYQNAACNHYNTQVANMTPAEFIDAEIGMLHETLTQYGPVNRYCAYNSLALLLGGSPAAARITLGVWPTLFARRARVLAARRAFPNPHPLAPRRVRRDDRLSGGHKHDGALGARIRRGARNFARHNHQRIPRRRLRDDGLALHARRARAELERHEQLRAAQRGGRVLPPERDARYYHSRRARW